MLSEKEIEELFSVMPERESKRAQTELRARLSRRAQGRETWIAWVDLDRSMSPVAAGITDFEGLSSSRINISAARSKMQPELAELMSVLDHDEVRVGQIQASRYSDRFLWVVPISPLHASPETVRVSHRALSVSFHVLSLLIAMFNPDAGLTAAESRVASQVVAGLSLADSAKLDGIQTETRRGQLKRACAKLSVSGQGALIRLVLSQAIQLLFLIDEEMRASTSISDFATQHLPDTVRVELHYTSDGRPIRLFEVGDPGGRPIIVAHGLFFVPLLQRLATYGSLAGLRFIMPLRYGYVSTPEEAAASDPDSQTALAELMAQYKDQSPVLMGQMMGCSVAVNFALAHPRMVSHLLLVSPFFGRPREGQAVYLSRIMKVVARFRADGFLYRLVAAQFAKTYAKPQNVRTALDRVFGSSKRDAAVLVGEEAGIPPVDTWFGQTFQDSVTGIAEDFKRASDFEIEDMKKIAVPCTVLSGEEDPLIEHAALKAALGDATTFKSIPGAGHFAAVTDLPAILDALAERG